MLEYTYVIDTPVSCKHLFYHHQLKFPVKTYVGKPKISSEKVMNTKWLLHFCDKFKKSLMLHVSVQYTFIVT
jgi:hypothetical protein